MDATTITLKRAALAPARPGGRPLGWCYSYTTPVDVDWRSADGTIRPGPRAGEYITYGRGLDALRGMLRRKYGPAVKIVTTW